MALNGKTRPINNSLFIIIYLENHENNVVTFSICIYWNFIMGENNMNTSFSISFDKNANQAPQNQSGVDEADGGGEVGFMKIDETFYGK